MYFESKDQNVQSSGLQAKVGFFCFFFNSEHNLLVKVRHALVCLTHGLYCCRLVCEMQLRVGMSPVCIWKV